MNDPTFAERIEEAAGKAANLKYEAEIAEDRADRIFAALFIEEEGNIKERECRAKINEKYQAALRSARSKKHAHNVQLAKQKAEEIAFEEFRTHSANDRAAKNAA